MSKIKDIMFLLIFMAMTLAACGIVNEPDYPEGATYPNTYPPQ